MRIYTDPCTRRTYVDRGLGGWQPLGVVVSAGVMAPVVASVLREPTEVSQPTLVRTPNAPGLGPKPNTTACTTLWQNQRAMAAIRDGVAFHGVATATRAIDSVLQGGEWTVAAFPSPAYDAKDLVANFLRTTRPSYPASTFVGCATNPQRS